MHVEGLGHSIYALDKLGYYEDTELWTSLLNQIEKRKTENFLVEYLKNANGDPRSFDYIGKKGGFPNNTAFEHGGQGWFNEATQGLFFEDQYHLFELKQGLMGAQESGVLPGGLTKSLDKVGFVLG